MARTAVTYSNLVGNGSLADPAGTALNPGAGNGHTIANADAERTLLRVTNTHSSAHNVTLKAGTYPPAIASGQGDVVVAVPANTGVAWIGPFESGRFLQNDGSVLVDVETAHAGTITAFRLPKAV
ncbi:hypothetical protein [Amycolatopsis sp. BJA-103]|uniref:hypothetical protein n=1 Tax=Amycolatopsis sp. BJA-103 TaxID=1911175 RepID=UPI000C763962|nr:hypothetical protein [Amycolatopsis sp. BJA-103]AUI56789.1 hypothetical protein BKN51_00220 [Amycolatopsis sp. BJA-103]PNE13110.1 hypothetical protein B1H26_42360 [Amycolatopsis sp. BJA-103]